MSVVSFLVGLVFAHRLRAHDEPFGTIADAAPFMVRVAGINHDCTYVNRGWLDFTGGRLNEELGAGWTNSVHPDDRRRLIDAYNDAIDHAKPFTIEYRLRRRDGEFRWILDSGVPWYGPRRHLVGYIDSAVDISDRKRAEETLRDLGGRLIAAQEEERRRVARQLHDDVSQRLALLSVELEHLHLQRSGRDAADERWSSVSKAAAEIAADLHRISHQLHPTRLEALGLVATISGFCQELRSQQRLQVRFTHEGVAKAIPGDVALCLYRVVQEALLNVITHSGVTDADVHLAGCGDGLLLRVSDSGGGFVPERRGDVGLGLLSMRERVLSLGGQIVVHAAPGRGTRISVRIGLQPTMSEPRLA
jgi:PAS domain S-box-containing protein